MRSRWVAVSAVVVCLARRPFHYAQHRDIPVELRLTRQRAMAWNVDRFLVPAQRVD